MSNETNNTHQELDNPLDMEYSKPTRARFLFYLGFFGIFIFSWAGCYNLYEHEYQKNDKMTYPSSTLYEPTYK